MFSVTTQYILLNMIIGFTKENKVSIIVYVKYHKIHNYRLKSEIERVPIRKFVETTYYIAEKVHSALNRKSLNKYYRAKRFSYEISARIFLVIFEYVNFVYRTIEK